MSAKLIPTALLSAAAFFALSPSAAFGGRMMATGHDLDLHCWPSNPTSAKCSLLRAAVTYVRGGAPNVTLRVLAIDRPPFQLLRALDNIGVPVDVMSPQSNFGAALDTSVYSAVVVASDETCNGCDLHTPPDASDIALKASAIRTFFNKGGGVLALAGADNAAAHYAFLPLPVGGDPDVEAPFEPTNPLGLSLNLTIANTNCCLTHNTFSAPPPVEVAETDALGRAETVVAEGTVSGPRAAPVLAPPAIAPAGVDHYRCYAVVEAPFEAFRVSLRDQFGGREVSVREPRQLCNPVEVRDETGRRRLAPVLHPREHYVCHATVDLDLGPAPRERTVRLRNHFGAAVVTRTGSAQALCLPSDKRVARDRKVRLPLQRRRRVRLRPDHLRCYGVARRNATRTVSLRDQFGRVRTRVVRLVRLCNPTVKRLRRGSTRILAPQAHLACYEIRDLDRTGTADVVVRNQFGERRLRVVRPETLCLPSFKQVLRVHRPPGPVPSTGPFPVAFSVAVTGTVCDDGSGSFVHTVSGETRPARDGTATAALRGPGGRAGEPRTTALSDGRFAVQARTPATPGIYRWTVSVVAADGGVEQGAVETDVPQPPPRC